MKGFKYCSLSLVLIVLIFAGGCSSDGAKESLLQNENSSAIVLSHNTSVRIAPFIFSARIALLNKGNTVKILEKSAGKTWIGNTSDHWYHIAIADGTSGWVFGRTIRVIESSSSDEVKEMVTKFWKEEADTLTKDLAGKWWSINRFGDFTYHGLILFDDGSYHSYRKGNEAKPIKGEFNFDIAKGEIIFLGGTSFKGNLNFIRRGRSYFLFRKDAKKKELRFKKIKVDISAEKEQKKKDENK